MMNNDRPVFQPYPAYKDSGVPWLGEIPAHWEVKRGKHLFRCIDVRSKTGEEELLTVSSEHGVVPRKSANVTMFKAESYVGYKLCWPDDLVINSLWAWARGLGVSRYHGITSSAYGVYRLREETEGDPWFIHQLVRSVPFHWELQVRSKGIWTSRLQLTDESFLGAPFPVPPPDEQRAIARFLEAIDRLTRRYISAQRRLIALLTEQKQALIQQAVTRGLNPDAPLKDSGIEWLGEIPAHWEVRAVKRYFAVDLGKMLNIRMESDQDIRLPYLNAANIHWDEIHLEKVNAMAFSLTQLNRYRLQKGDLLVTEGGATVGRSATWNEELPECYYQNSLNRARARSYLSTKYLYYWMFFVTQSGYIDVVADKATFGHLTNEKLCRLPILVPPADEAKAIVEHLDDCLADFAMAEAKLQRQIDLVREYRTRLIADVVTGKLDVRGVALPVEVGRTSESASHLDLEDETDFEKDVEETGSDEEALDE